MNVKGEKVVPFSKEPQASAWLPQGAVIVIWLPLQPGSSELGCPTL